MAWIAGADGCRIGWFRVAFETGHGGLRFDVVERADQLLRTPPRPLVLALDVPIGLPDAGPRACDRAARKRLGRPRGSSVFPAPIRPALAASSRIEAARITQKRDGRRVSAQCWALFPKIREVDALLRSDPAARKRIREVHPEISFWAWAGGVPMRASKKRAPGRAERRRLIERWMGRQALHEARNGYPKRHLADDDILDAFAALWTAERIREGAARTLPDPPARDSRGLPMQIVY